MAVLAASRWHEDLEPQIRVEEKLEDGKLVVRAEAPGIDPEKDVEISDGRR